MGAALRRGGMDNATHDGGCNWPGLLLEAATRPGKTGAMRDGGSGPTLVLLALLLRVLDPMKGHGLLFGALSIRLMGIGIGVVCRLIGICPSTSSEQLLCAAPPSAWPSQLESSPSALSRTGARRKGWEREGADSSLLNSLVYATCASLGVAHLAFSSSWSPAPS